MKTPSYKKINAFTSATSLGNPVACLFLHKTQVLSGDVMLPIAQKCCLAAAPRPLLKAGIYYKPERKAGFFLAL